MLDAVTNQHRLSPVAVLAVLLGLAAAARAAGERQGSGPGYAKSRLLDLLDTFEIGLAAGPGLGAEANCLVGSFGARASKAWWIRLGQRSSLLYERSGTYSVLPGYQGWYDLGVREVHNVWPAAEKMGIKRRKSTVRLGWKVQEGNLNPFDGPLEGEPARQLDAGLDVHLLVLGARVRVRVTELADFVLGLFGKDLLGDDRRPEEGQSASPTPAASGTTPAQ